MNGLKNDFLVAIALVIAAASIGGLGGAIAAHFKNETVSTCGGVTDQAAEGVPLQKADCR